MINCRSPYLQLLFPNVHVQEHQVAVEAAKLTDVGQNIFLTILAYSALIEFTIIYQILPNFPPILLVII